MIIKLISGKNYFLNNLPKNPDFEDDVAEELDFDLDFVFTKDEFEEAAVFDFINGDGIS